MKKISNASENDVENLLFYPSSIHEDQNKNKRSKSNENQTTSDKINKYKNFFQDYENLIADHNEFNSNK